MDQINNIMDTIDDVKEQMKDCEYKLIVDELMALTKKIQKEPVIKRERSLSPVRSYLGSFPSSYPPIRPITPPPSPPIRPIRRFSQYRQSLYRLKNYHKNPITRTIPARPGESKTSNQLMKERFSSKRNACMYK